MRTVQLRDVPEDLYRKLKAHATESGQSLSKYLLEECRRIVAKPTPEELMRRAEEFMQIVRDLPPVKLKKSPAQMLREERTKRDIALERHRRHR